MICPKCNTLNNDEAKFCSKCGAPLKINENKVRIRKMTTRYGSNSLSNKSITYSTILMHYQVDIIDSVIIHELAHCYVSNHSQEFYKIVYKFCPNYKKLHNNLKKGNYEND